MHCGPTSGVTASFFSSFIKALYKPHGASSVRFDSQTLRSWNPASQPILLATSPKQIGPGVFEGQRRAVCSSRIASLENMRWGNCLQQEEQPFSQTKVQIKLHGAIVPGDGCIHSCRKEEGDNSPTLPTWSDLRYISLPSFMTNFPG